MTEEFTPAQYRAILAISRTTRVVGHLPSEDLGPWRASTIRSLAWRGIVTTWWAKKCGHPSPRVQSVTLTDYGKTLVPAAIEWEKAQ